LDGGLQPIKLCQQTARYLASNLQGRTVSKITVGFTQSFVGNKRLEFLGSPQGRGIRKIKDFDTTAGF